jgi:small subunit ribosomal protein S17
MMMTEATGISPTEQRGIRKVWQGRVTSDKMEKTVVVSVENRVRHPLYGRTMTRTTKFKAHDETNDAHVGDTVEIVECRPLSKDKRFRIQRIVQRAK